MHRVHDREQYRVPVWEVEKHRPANAVRLKASIPPCVTLTISPQLCFLDLRRKVPSRPSGLIQILDLLDAQMAERAEPGGGRTTESRKLAGGKHVTGKWNHCSFGHATT